MSSIGWKDDGSRSRVWFSSGTERLANKWNETSKSCSGRTKLTPPGGETCPSKLTEPCLGTTEGSEPGHASKEDRHAVHHRRNTRHPVAVRHGVIVYGWRVHSHSVGGRHRDDSAPS